MVDACSQCGRGGLCAVGFDFHMPAVEQGEEFVQFLLLEQGFSSGDDDVAAGAVAGAFGFDDVHDGSAYLRRRHFFGFLPFPRVGGVAPGAGEVAARKPEEDGGCALRDAFALDGVKDFGNGV